MDGVNTTTMVVLPITLTAQYPLNGTVNFSGSASEFKGSLMVAATDAVTISVALVIDSTLSIVADSDCDGFGSFIITALGTLSGLAAVSANVQAGDFMLAGGVQMPDGSLVFSTCANLMSVGIYILFVFVVICINKCWVQIFESCHSGDWW